MLLRNFKVIPVGIALLVAAVTSANAATFDVYALANSSSGGVGLSTINLSMGQAFNVSVSSTDLWNAGPLPRWSNADGLGSLLYATGTDESGQPNGTIIGADFGTWTQGGLTARYGTLVGKIGSGNFFSIGTSYSGIAASTGTLYLYYWDSNNFDNTEFVTANITTPSGVPLPAALPLMLSGLGVLGFASLRRKEEV